MLLKTNKNNMTGRYNPIDRIANPNPTIRKAENKYPTKSSRKVTLFKCSSQSFESDDMYAIFPQVKSK